MRKVVVEKINIEKINCNAKKAMEILMSQTWLMFEYKIDLLEGKLVVNVDGLDEDCIVKLRLIMVKDFSAEGIAKSILYQLLIRNENTVKMGKGELKIDGKTLGRTIMGVKEGKATIHGND